MWESWTRRQDRHSLGLRSQTLEVRAPSSQSSDGQESGAVAPNL